jgi:NAD(P)-dependent dehydrogenase (short-subunit alcohol dehydrogenase family)
MAIKKVIEIDVDQVQAMGGLDALQQSLVETETKSASLKAELRKLKEQLAQLPEGSEEYNKIAQRAGEVSDQIGDINTRIKALGSDTKNIDAVVQGAQALSGAFSIATSASALLGEENKDLQETMLKVESAIGLTVGIQSVANALQKETALSIGLSTAATKIQTGAQIVYATVVGTTTGALKALRVALVSTGVGALVVALGFLISKMTESTEATEDQKEAQDALNESLKTSTELYGRFSKSIDFANKASLLRAKIAGASEKELQKIQQDGFDSQLKNLKEEEVNLKKQLNNQKASYETRLKILDELDRNSKAQIDLDRERQIQQLGFESDVADQRRDNQAKINEEAKRKSDERLRIAEEEYKRLRELENQRGRSAEAEFDALLKLEADAKERNRVAGLTELEQVQQKYDAQIEALKQAGISTVELEIEKANAINDINLKIQEEEEKVRLANKEADEKELERKKLLKEQELALVGDTLGKISFLLGKNSKAGKAFAIAQALINTYQGITAELATKALTPYEIGLKVVNVAYIAKTGFDAVKKIASTSTSGSGGSGGSQSLGGGGGASATPQFNLVGQSSTNQLTATIAGQQNRPVQTYVVGSQVTSQQALDRNAQQASVFG